MPRPEPGHKRVNGETREQARIKSEKRFRKETLKIVAKIKAAEQERVRWASDKVNKLLGGYDDKPL